MSQDQFQLVYDGADVREGGMDVYDLAPALLSVGDLIRDVNRFFNEDRSNVALQVRSDFQRGSFEVFLILDQGIVEQAKQVLFGGTVIDAKGLVDLIFGHPVSLIAGTTGLATAVTGVIKVYKMLRGQKPKHDSVTIEDHSTTIIQDIHIESKTAQLYMNDAIRSRIDRVVRPLAKEGIDTLEVRKGKELIERLEKAEVPDRVYESARESRTAEQITDTREALLKVTKANLDDKKGKWGFSDGTAKFGADVNDAAFQEKLDKREIGFYKGDVLRVVLKTVQTAKPSGTLKTKYSIEQVLEYKPQPAQAKLLPPTRAVSLDDV
jgi:hypothetical protein